MSVRSLRWRLAEAIAPGPIRGVFAEDDTEPVLPRTPYEPPSAEVIAEWRRRGIIRDLGITPTVDAAARLRDLGFPDYDYLPAVDLGHTEMTNQ